MLEQFRILAAALRLREFGLAELAKESGIADGTVQKTVYRKKDLFPERPGARSGQRGGQPKRFGINENAIRALLQLEADSLELPSPDDDLTAALAEDTMCRLLPRVSPDEREGLLATVNDQLEASGPKSGVLEDLRVLYRALRDLVLVERWFSTHVVHVVPDATRPRYLINAILSAEDAEARRKDPAQSAAAVQLIDSLPADLRKIAVQTKSLLVENPAPVEHWWFAIPAAVWTVLGSAFWKELAADLIMPKVVDVPLPSLAGPDVYVTAMHRDQRSIGQTVYITELKTPVPVSKPSARKPARVRGGLGGYFGGPHSKPYALDFQELADGLVRIRADYSKSTPMRAKRSLFMNRFRDDNSPLIASFDFHFGLRRLIGATLISDKVSSPAAHEWVQFLYLLIEGNESLVSKGSIDDWPFANLTERRQTPLHLPRHFDRMINDVKWHDGLYLPQFSAGTIQIRLNPGHEIDVFEGVMIDDKLMRGGDAKTGEVWWLDVALDTGLLTVAHIQQGDRRLVIPVPFDDLQYDPERQGFVLLKNPTAFKIPDIASPEGMSNSESRPDRFH